MDVGTGSANHYREDGVMTIFRIAKRLSSFLDSIHSSISAEGESQSHQELTMNMVNLLKQKPYWPGDGAFILDVGCGQGYALEYFKQAGCEPVGLTLGKEDAEVCRNSGFNVVVEDMSFTSFPDATFDMVWARHSLEHSPWPLLTLYEFSRVCKPNGLLYAEMPAPGTECYHECNENHYSVLPPRNWRTLIERAGFRVLEQFILGLELSMGKDQYYVFIGRRVSDS